VCTARMALSNGRKTPREDIKRKTKRERERERETERERGRGEVREFFDVGRLEKEIGAARSAGLLLCSAAFELAN